MAKKTWAPEDIGPERLRCMGPKRSRDVAAGLVQVRIDRLTDSLTAARKALAGEELFPHERALAGAATPDGVALLERQITRLEGFRDSLEAEPARDVWQLAAAVGVTDRSFVETIRNGQCGTDLRPTIAAMLNDGVLQEDGRAVGYDCPDCGAKHSVSRTPPDPE